jgi:hypothetical protein
VCRIVREHGGEGLSLPGLMAQLHFALVQWCTLYCHNERCKGEGKNL